MKNLMLFILILFNCVFGLVSTVPGTVSSDWIGNSLSYRELISGTTDTSNRMNHKWVQDALDDMWVNSDGTVYARSNWDEAGRVCGIYKNGDVLGQMTSCRGGQGGENGAIVGDGTYVYETSGVRFPDWSAHGWGINRSNLDGSFAGFADGQAEQASYYIIRDSGWAPFNKAFLTIDKNSKEMYVCDSTDTIYVFNINTNSSRPIAKFYIPNVVGMTSNNNNKLWVVSNGILGLYSNRGIFQNKTVTKALRPTKLHYSVKDELIVWDDSLCMLYLLKNPGMSNQTYRIFGIKNGAYSTKGKFENTMLYPNLKGIGVDASGKLYLGWGWWPTPTNTDIRSYNINGTLNWRLSCNTFTQVPGFDPKSDGKDLYYMQTKHNIDYTKPYGHRVTQSAYTFDRRQNNGMSPGGTTIVRWIQNKKFLFRSYCDLCADGFTIWKMRDSFSIPSAKVHGAEIYAWWVDTIGDVWSADFTVRQFQNRGIDGSGNPIYDTLNPTIYSAPNNLGYIKRMHYDPTTDVMILTGYNDAHPFTGDVTGVGLVMGKYSHWKSGNPTNDWIVTLPFDNPSVTTSMKSFWVEGNYIFFAPYSRPPQSIEVYRIGDGVKIGELLPGNEIGGNQLIGGFWAYAGWVDMVWGIQATVRKNGEYIILIEDDVNAKTDMYRWCPSGNCP